MKPMIAFILLLTLPALSAAKNDTISVIKEFPYAYKQELYPVFCLPELRLKAGVEFGFNYSYLQQNVSSSRGSDFGMHSQLKGSSACISILSDIAITNTVGIQLRLGLTAIDVSNSGVFNAYTPYTISDDASSETAPQNTRQTKNSLGYYASALLWRWNVSPKVTMHVGGLYYSLATSTQSSLDNHFYRLNYDEATMKPYTTPSIVGLEWSSEYTIPLAPNAVLFCNLRSQYFLTSPFKDRDYTYFRASYQLKNAQLYNIQCSFGAWFSL